MLDLAFRNVSILDGTGTPAFTGDVGVEGGRIAAVGEASAAQTDIDGAGMCLAPGFIDTHAHDDGAFMRYPDMAFKLAQGVTSVVSGNCGFSAVWWGTTRCALSLWEWTSERQRKLSLPPWAITSPRH